MLKCFFRFQPIIILVFLHFLIQSSFIILNALVRLFLIFPLKVYLPLISLNAPNLLSLHPLFFYHLQFFVFSIVLLIFLFQFSQVPVTSIFDPHFLFIFSPTLIATILSFLLRFFLIVLVLNGPLLPF